jgi:ABC-2 type transport system ATP-binding protein
LGLDVEATQYVKALVKAIASEGCAILLTTHQLDIAEELSDRVAIIQKGEIIAASPTRDLIQQFSGTAYTIEVEGELDPARVRVLQELVRKFRQGECLYG